MWGLILPKIWGFVRWSIYGLYMCKVGITKGIGVATAVGSATSDEFSHSFIWKKKKRI